MDEKPVRKLICDAGGVEEQPTISRRNGALPVALEQQQLSESTIGIKNIIKTVIYFSKVRYYLRPTVQPYSVTLPISSVLLTSGEGG